MFVYIVNCILTLNDLFEIKKNTITFVKNIYLFLKIPMMNLSIEILNNTLILIKIVLCIWEIHIS